MGEPQCPRIPESGLTYLNYGVSGFVVDAVDFVIKYPLGDHNKDLLAIEHKIYKRLGSHPRITKFLGEKDGNILLERLQDTLRKRLDDLSGKGEVPLPEHIHRWALQLTEALQYVHSRGVMQADIGSHNALLDRDDNVKLVDFAGSSLEERGQYSKAIALPGFRHSSPNIPVPSIQAELFALGSTLYEVETTRRPYQDYTDSEVEKLFGAGIFPDTTALMLGNVIKKCWWLKYKDDLEILEDLRSFGNKS